MIRVRVTEQPPVRISTRDRDVLWMAEGEVYTGDYTVTPQTAEAVVLPTRNKTMKDDVTVFKIPRWDVANQFGKTVYIGEENINGIQ